MHQPIFTNDIISLGILISVLAIIFYTSGLENKFFKKFYTFVPALLLAYFVPALLNWPLGLIANEWYDKSAVIEYINQNYSLNLLNDISFNEMKQIISQNNIDLTLLNGFKQNSQLNFVASNYFLPACLILLTLSVDFKGILSLGPKALIMFLSGTFGIVIGGPLTLFILVHFFPNLLPFSGDDLWKGMSTIAGSWIGGSANQTAIKEIYQVNETIFAAFIVVDVIVSNIWLGILLYGVSIRKKMDSWLKADTSSIDKLTVKLETYRKTIEKTPTTVDFLIMLAVAYGGVALSQVFADIISPAIGSHKEFLETYKLTWLSSNFFWLIILATTIGLLLSFTKARRLEGVGASKWGTIFLYFLIATIGIKMNLMEIGQNISLFLVGIIWMSFHVIIMILVGRLIKSPFLFVAVGSQANIGGVASASLVVSAFSTFLAPVGVLLAVLGYAIGTYGGIISSYLMQWISGN
jgi:uncharacterized membrane protein